jgi:two-component sensor histidine kinase
MLPPRCGRFGLIPLEHRRFGYGSLREDRRGEPDIVVTRYLLESSRLAPRLARRHVASALPPISSDRAEDVLLMVSEVVTNAVVHGEGRISLDVEVAGGAVRVSVSDGGRGQVVAHQMAGASSSRGRGLAIVNRLSTRWGVTGLGSHGKTVWFECLVR